MSPLQALHAGGLRVVLDVVYNHTFHSGLPSRDQAQHRHLARNFLRMMLLLKDSMTVP